MIKKLTDYLHYYIDQQAICVKGSYNHPKGKTVIIAYDSIQWIASSWNKFKYLPILRQINDMTEEEFKVIFKPIQPDNISDDQYKDAIDHISKEGFGSLDFGDMPASEVFDLFHRLLKQGFDLFGLINAGLAIDRATLTTSL